MINNSLTGSLSEINSNLSEVTQSLNTFTDSGKVEQLHVGADGKPYIKYKVGADTVDLKLGETSFGLYVGQVYGYNSVPILSITGISGYENLTANNFVAVIVGYRNHTSPVPSNDNPIARVTGYNAVTGIVSVSCGWHHTGSAAQGITVDVYTKK